MIRKLKIGTGQYLSSSVSHVLQDGHDQHGEKCSSHLLEERTHSERRCVCRSSNTRVSVSIYYDRFHPLLHIWRKDMFADKWSADGLRTRASAIDRSLESSRIIVIVASIQSGQR